jgi:hypothetical protein
VQSSKKYLWLNFGHCSSFHINLGIKIDCLLQVHDIRLSHFFFSSEEGSTFSPRNVMVFLSVTMYNTQNLSHAYDHIPLSASFKV